MWIPDLFSPMNIFSMDEKTNMCFAKIMQAEIDPTKSPDDPKSLIRKPGITISVYGQTEKTEV